MKSQGVGVAQSLALRTRLAGEHRPCPVQLGHTQTCPAPHLGWPLAEHQQSQPSEAIRHPCLPLEGQCRNWTVTCCLGHVQRPLLWREVPTRKTMSVFAGKNRPLPELGFLRVSQEGCAHKNTARPSTNPETRAVSILDVDVQFFPPLCWLFQLCLSCRPLWQGDGGRATLLLEPAQLPPANMTPKAAGWSLETHSFSRLAAA